ncbi:MAG: hypothetical protein HY682_03215 [Chloroflexi bacterium]|nr:hypothetical protein [Chloroflexota bacterium]
MPQRSSVPIYLEAGRRRVIAGAIEWPGWCRSGRDEAAALEALVAYGPRYVAAIRAAGGGLKPPPDVSAFEVTERLQGDATTDFGAPGIPPAADDHPVSNAELDRLIALLEATWTAFDRAAEAAKSAVLRKGPRGGGRELGAIVRHVLDAEGSYASRMGGRFRPEPGADVRNLMRDVRAEMVAALRARARGEPLPESARTRKIWTPRYGIRRSAWHALDHAWEIEDRASS